MRVAKDDVDVRMEIPGAIIRQRLNFGDASGFDTFSGECFTLSAGVDTTPLFEGLEGDACQCPHWGYVLHGRLTTFDATGAEETLPSLRPRATSTPRGSSTIRSSPGFFSAAAMAFGSTSPRSR